MIENIDEGGNMALVICPECGKEVSDNAERCPHCGNDMHPGLTAASGCGEVLHNFGCILMLLPFAIIPLFIAWVLLTSH